MARKSDTNNAFGIILFIAFIIGVIGYFLIKWLIIGLIILIVAISVWIVNVYRKNNRKKAINNIIENIFKDSNIKPTDKISKKELKEKLGLFDIDIYNELFDYKIRLRGQAYYTEKKVQNVKQNDNKWSCTVKGTDEYNVSITFENDKIAETHCNCMYYNEEKKNCKHIYALLIKAKSERNIPIILETITDYSNKLSEVINEETKYINKHQKNIKLNSDMILVLDNNIEKINKKLNNIMKNIEKYKYNESILLDTLIDLIESTYLFNKKIEEIIIEAVVISNPVSIDKVYNANNDIDKIRLRDIVAGCLIADEIVDRINKKDEKVDEKLEKIMDDYCLEEWQKELVRKRRV